MNGSLIMLAAVAVGVVLLVLAATVSALRTANRPRGLRHNAYGGDGGGGAWAGWSGSDGGGSSCGGDGGGGGGGD